VLTALTLAALLVFTVIVALVGFRISAQFMAIADLPWPATWLYDAGGTTARPFRESETTPNSATGIIEFSSLVALEAYLMRLRLGQPCSACQCCSGVTYGTGR
jgi:hypothetical protein